MQRVRDALNRIAACEKHTGHLFPQNGVIREARAALAVLNEIEAAQPQWTSEPPTEEGWYACYLAPCGTRPGYEGHVAWVEADGSGGFWTKVEQGRTDQYDVSAIPSAFWLRITAPPKREEAPQ